MLCQICATSFRCSLHVSAKFCMLLKNKNIVKNAKNCLKTSDLTYMTCPWRSGRVVEGAPLLREKQTTSNTLKSLHKSLFNKLTVPEMSQSEPFLRVLFLH